ncbi:SDR family NAD(P)-dependent oxidoreductase [Xenorhabdus anantnagensis]|uniref:SDR family oxidoreductase n=1 Tax=Xenorhabdus anantnagensis TaxID=3025875 RepID=A0ABT5LWB5_9GAMM|nr:SDR family oxidoreductase [Xenorhabdus anantnagensis]MDC9597290.1 SDR family oxidoreductase [Xenorhabdus anantnagensis]
MLTFIVTGAASGIGYAVCQKLLTTGYRIIAIDVNSEGLNKLAEQSPGLVDILQIDLTDENAIANQLVPLFKEGKLPEILQGIVISHGKDNDNKIGDSDIWDSILAANLHSVQRLLSNVVPNILSGGRIVIISSILGKAGKKHNSAYCVSKHALLGLTKSLALDLAERQITVNAVLPSWVDTPMLLKGLEPQAKLLGCSTSALLRRIEKRIPLKRLVSPQDVANAVMFFISLDAAMITAQGLVIDGGDGCGA